MSDWDVAAANAALIEHFAPWVKALDLHVEHVDANGARVRMPFDASLCRQGGIVSGQALAALADTAMVFAIAARGGAFRPMATVDLHVTFMRAVSGSDVVADAVVERLGRTLAFARVAMRAAPNDPGKGPAEAVVASAVGTFALS